MVIPTDPRFVFAAIDGIGLFRSLDAGQSWIMMSTEGLTDKSIQSFAVCPSGGTRTQAPGVAASFGMIHRCSAGRRSTTAWLRSISQRYPAMRRVSCWRGPDDQGLFRSTDEGSTWKRTASNSGIRTGANDRKILALFTLPGIVGLGTLNGAYKSLDGGKTWVSAGLIGQGVYDFAYDRSGGERIWVGTNSGGVFTSEDAGETWTALGGPAAIYSVVQGWDLLIYAGTRDGGVYRFEDGRWILDGLDEPNRRVFLVRWAAYNRLLAGTNDGLWAAVTIPRTPTPTPTETAVPTETPSPTETPVIPRVVASLWSSPDGPVDHGDQITYHIDYQVLGAGLASSVVITNAIPSNVNLVAGSIAPAGLASVSDGIISWQLGDLPSGTSGAVGYKVVVSAPTSTPTLSLTATRTGSPSPSPSLTASATPTPTASLTLTSTDCSSGKVAGYVFVDGDGDASQDPDESGVPGMTVRLYEDGPQIAQTTTSTSGSYQFAGLPLGDYEVSYDLSAAHSATSPTRATVRLSGCQALHSFGMRSCSLLSTTIAPSNSGAMSPSPAPNCQGGTNGQNLYDYGTTVSLRAQPAAGYMFADWSGDVTASINPVSVILAGDKVLTATFTACVPLTTSVSPSGGGTASASPPPNCEGGGPYLYNPGTRVSLAANPATNWNFDNWSGDLTGSTNPSEITMNAARSVTANFEACVVVNTAVSPSNGGSASVSTAPNCQGGITYRPNNQVNITTAASNSYFLFKNWTATSGTLGNAGSQNTTLTLGAGDTTVTANYDECKTLTPSVFPVGDGSVSIKTAPNCGGDRYLPGTEGDSGGHPERRQYLPAVERRCAGCGTGEESCYDHNGREQECDGVVRDFLF